MPRMVLERITISLLANSREKEKERKRKKEREGDREVRREN